MKPISDKLLNPTDRYSSVKRRKSPNEDQNVLILVKKKQHASCARKTPIGVDKMFSTPIGDSSRFSGKKGIQSISVINNFFPDHLKKNER